MADDLIDPPIVALLPGRVGLLVRIVCRAGGRTAVLDVLNRYSDQLASEPGTEAFLISLDPDDDTIVWLYEWFANLEALDAHRASKPFAVMMEEMPEHLAAPPALIRMDPLRFNVARNVLSGDTFNELL